MIAINKAIDMKCIDERLMIELEGRKEMAEKSVFGLNACAADAYAGLCATAKTSLIAANLCAGFATAGL